MTDLNHIRRTLDAARHAYAEAHPEQARMLPLGDNAEYHIINAIASLTDEVETLADDLYANNPEGWVSNAGAVEIAPEPEAVAPFRDQDHEAGDIDPDTIHDTRLSE
jgi:hypothetical protein